VVEEIAHPKAKRVRILGTPIEPFENICEDEGASIGFGSAHQGDIEGFGLQRRRGRGF
jgi:hypothetical protein